MAKPELPFSVTVQTSEAVVLHCLRALAFYSQGGRGKFGTFDGTGEQEWKENNQQVTFRFSELIYQQRFLHEASRLLPYNSWLLRKLDGKDLPAHVSPKPKGKKLEEAWD